MGARLFAFPADAFFAVFDEDALGEEVVANGVGAGEVAGFFGLGALGYEGVDVGVGEGEIVEKLGGGLVDAAFFFCPLKRGAGDGGVVVFEDGEYSVEELEDFQDLSGFSLCKRPCISPTIGEANDIKNRCTCLSRIEIVGKGSRIAQLCFSDEAFMLWVDSYRPMCQTLGPWAFEHALAKGAKAVDGVGGFGETVEGEVHLVAVGDGDEQEADGGGAVALEEEVAEGVEVALGL